MRETRVRSLGWADPLEKEMATHSSILAWKIPWTEELGWLPSSTSSTSGGTTSLIQELTGILSPPYSLVSILPYPLERQKRQKVKLLSRVRLFVTPWTVADQAPLSMGIL